MKIKRKKNVDPSPLLNNKKKFKKKKSSHTPSPLNN
jgi:hypothetical protein